MRVRRSSQSIYGHGWLIYWVFCVDSPGNVITYPVLTKSVPSRPMKVQYLCHHLVGCRGGSSFSVRGGLKIGLKKYFTVKGSRGTPPGKFLTYKRFVMQSKAYWALFLTQYITKS